MTHTEYSKRLIMSSALACILSMAALGTAIADEETAVSEAQDAIAEETEAEVAESGAAGTAYENTRVARDAAARAKAVEAAQAEKTYSEGMSIPIDGSSLEAFDKSMEKIKAESTEDEYTTLQNAIDYLLIYDLSARRNKEKLAANLNGLTGKEVVEQVKW